MNDPHNRNVSRRRFLRRCLGGTTITLTLPWMESLALRAEDSGKKTFAEPDDAKPPIRFGCLFFSNGVEPAHWWARRDGEGRIQYGQSLSPLAANANDIVFIKGLFNEQAALHPSPHMGRMANLLSGAWVSRDQSEIRCGTTMDQVLAQRLGRSTEIPSLVLGVEPTELRLEDGLSMIYGSCISWAADTKPVAKEIYPARVYDLIVGRSDRQLDRSILDELVEDADDVRNQISSRDRAKLDEYFDSIRDIERRLDRAERTDALEGWRPSVNEPTFGRPREDLPQNVSEHMRLMLDLIVLAFQMDKTRIATCMLNNDLSQMNFGFLEGVEGSLHLDLTHNGRDPELEAMYLKTNQFHAQQLSYLIDRMKGIDEGGSTLFDNSILMFCSNLFDGDLHQATEMPVLLSGGGGGTLGAERIIDVSAAEVDDRRACGLYLAIMDRMGIELPSFGDAKKRVAIA